MFVITRTRRKGIGKLIIRYSIGQDKDKEKVNEKEKEYEKIETVSFKKNIINDFKY
jgi:hypothetical protein